MRRTISGTVRRTIPGGTETIRYWKKFDDEDLLPFPQLDEPCQLQPPSIFKIPKDPFKIPKSIFGIW